MWGKRWKEFFILVIVIWIIVVVHYFSTDNSFANGDEILRLVNDLDDARTENEHLQTNILQYKKSMVESNEKIEQLKKQLLYCQQHQQQQNNVPKSPNLMLESESTKTRLEDEIMRRQMFDDVMEMGYMMTSRINKQEVDLQHFKLQHRAMLIHARDLMSVNNEWRRNENMRLKQLIAKRMDFVQNPSDCTSSRRLVCKLNKGCGFGCQLHHLVYCFMIAYGTERTLIVDSQNWRYSQEGWDSVFEPVSKTCTDVQGGTPQQWRGEEESASHLIVSLPIVDGLSRPPPYMPLAIPEDIADDLIAITANPSAWWVGMFVRFLWKPQPWLQQQLDQQSHNFMQPIVGIQVRRTDKVGTEAAYHSIDEYMLHVDDWFATYQLRHNDEVIKKRVYVATDDPTVLPEAKEKYPDYEFLGDLSISQSAQLNSRYTKTSLLGVIKDIHFLSKCHYLVCTFSSQVCRAAYELMVTRGDDNDNEDGDLSEKFHSLDDIYYFGGQRGPNLQKAKFAHDKRSEEEIDLRVGDEVAMAGNHWDGMSKARNLRTNKFGLFPSYKTQRVFSRVKYPTFDIQS